MQLENIYNGKSMSEISIQDMFDISETNPANKIYVDDEAIDQLFEVLIKTGRAKPDLEEIDLDTDILLADLLRFADCEINWEYTDGNESMHDTYRIFIFPNYRSILKNSQSLSAIIGFIKIHETIVPLAISPGIDTIGYGDIFFDDGTYVNFIDSQFDKMEYSIRDIYVYVSSIWYAIQIAATDPMTKDLFVTNNEKFENYSDNYILSADSIKEKLKG